MNTRTDHVITVGSGDSAYRVHIGSGLLERASDLISVARLAGVPRVVADRNVWRLHGQRLLEGFKSAGTMPPVLEIDAGEDRKNLESVYTI